jgi:hypothetical protein
VADAQISEGNGGSKTLLVSVSLAFAASEAVSVDYATLEAGA